MVVKSAAGVVVGGGGGRRRCRCRGDVSRSSLSSS